MVQICCENRPKIDIFATNLINEFDSSMNLKLEHCSNCHFCGESFSLANLTDLFSYVYFILKSKFYCMRIYVFFFFIGRSHRTDRTDDWRNEAGNSLFNSRSFSVLSSRQLLHKNIIFEAQITPILFEQVHRSNDRNTRKERKFYHMQNYFFFIFHLLLSFMISSFWKQEAAWLLLLPIAKRQLNPFPLSFST